MGEFTGKTVFITGAAKGQGKAVALAFAKEGANVAGFDLGSKISYPAYNRSSSSQLEELRLEIEALGGRAAVFAGDVRCAEDIEKAVTGAVKAFGAIDILFNNAGICAYGAVHELPEDEWDAMIDINLKGVWLTAKYVIPISLGKKAVSSSTIHPLLVCAA